jgi:hypothetical protein
MQNRAMFEAGPFLLLEPRRPDGFKGVDRLRLIPAAQASSPRPAGQEVNDALTRLKTAGLACEEVPGRQFHVLGGSQIFEGGGIRRYEHAFAILGEPGGGFLAMVSGERGHHQDEETTTETLAQAVDAVLSVYGARGASKPAKRGQ